MKKEEQPRTPLQQAAAEITAALDALELDPRIWINAAIKRAAEQTYPTPERAQAATAYLRSIAGEAKEICFAWDLQKARNLMHRTDDHIRRLAIQPMIQSFTEHLRQMTPEMVALDSSGQPTNWTSEEIAELYQYCENGASGVDRVKSFDANHVEFASGKSVDRATVRNNCRPSWQPLDEWQQTTQYQRMQTAHAKALTTEQARKAEQTVRYSSGPARMIGKAVA